MKGPQMLYSKLPKGKFSRTSVVGTYLSMLKYNVGVGLVKIYKSGDLYMKERHLDALFLHMSGCGKPFSLVFTEIYNPSWWEKLIIRFSGEILKSSLSSYRIEIPVRVKE